MARTRVTSKIYAGIGIAVLVLILITGILISIPSDTVDFRGTVDSVYFSEKDNCTYIEATSVFGEKITVMADSKISVKDISGEKFDIKALKKGDMIDLDYAHDTSENDGFVIAKWIEVCPLDEIPSQTTAS